MPHTRTYALILNWNGWADTLACLESLLRALPEEHCIVVWDNGSTDGSITRIQNWAAGIHAATPDVPAALQSLISPGVPKPVTLTVIDPEQQGCPTGRVTLIRGGHNLGYAGGNNAALRWALTQADCGYLWLLNNDTLVAADAWAQMHRCASGDPHDRPVGAEIYYMDRPDQQQAYGGQRIGRGPLISPRYVHRLDAIDYLTGVSLFMSRACMNRLGFFNEDYFLNAEDLELTYTYKRDFNRRHPGVPAFQVAGRIWHRESSSQSRNRFLHTYYYTRNLLYAARRISPLHGAATLAHAIVRIGLAAVRRQPQAMRGIATGIRDYRAGVVGAYRAPP